MFLGLVGLSLPAGECNHVEHGDQLAAMLAAMMITTAILEPAVALVHVLNIRGRGCRLRDLEAT